MKNKKITLTIAIPAYNEEKNITSLLISLINQNDDKYVLKGINVYSDASTDNTNKKVKALTKKYSIIKLVVDDQRKGKYFRVNQAFRQCKTDALVILDGDITLVGKEFLDKIVCGLILDPKAQLIAAHQILVRPKNFIGKIIYTNFALWDCVRWSIPNYDSPRNYYGSATAYRGSFARSVVIPNDLLDPHLFIYLMAAKAYGFRYCWEAKISYTSISTMEDFNKFIRRAIGKKDKKLEKIFGKNVRKVYFVPWKYKLIGVLKSFKYEPFYTPLSLFLILYMKIIPLIKIDSSSVWGVVSSTKLI